MALSGLLLLALAARSVASGIQIEEAGTLLEADRGAFALTTLSDGRVLVVGGATAMGLAPLSSTEVWDPRSRTWSFGPELRIPRNRPAVAELRDGRILVIGGARIMYVLAAREAEILDLERDHSRVIEGPEVERLAGVRPVSHEGRVLVIGGTEEGMKGTATSSIELFDPAGESFASWGRLPLPSSGYSLARLDGNSVLVAAGGYRCCGHPLNGPVRGSQSLIDLRAREVRPLPDLPGFLVQAGGLELGVPRDRSVVLAFCGLELGRRLPSGGWEHLADLPSEVDAAVPLGKRRLLAWGPGGGFVVDPMTGELLPVPDDDPDWPRDLSVRLAPLPTGEVLCITDGQRRGAVVQHQARLLRFVD